MPESGNLPSQSERLFFALWPDDDLRQQLARHSKPLTQAVHGRLVPTENFHITLAFLGNVDARQRECIEGMARDIVCPNFELTFDRVGHWSRSRALWLAPGNSPEPLNQLVADLHRGASACGLSLDERPYRPHLTLMRKVATVPEGVSIASIDWLVSSFVLLRSVPVLEGVRYEVLRQWPLRAEV